MRRWDHVARIGFWVAASSLWSLPLCAQTKSSQAELRSQELSLSRLESPSPDVCESERSFWNRLKQRRSVALCAELNAVHLHLPAHPQKAAQLLEEVAARVQPELLPDRYYWLDAFVKFHLKQWEPAWRAWTQIHTVRPAAQVPVSVRRALARTALQLGLWRESERLFQTVVLDTSSSREEQVRTLLELAFVAMQVEPAGVSRAWYWAQEAQRLGPHQLTPFVQGTLALIALRMDQEGRAAPLLEQLRQSEALVWLLEKGARTPRPAWFPWLPPGEELALRAAYEELQGGEGARQWWQEVLDQELSLPDHLREWTERRVRNGEGRE